MRTIRSTCEPSVMGVPSPVSEILLHFANHQNGQISLSDHGYSPWSSKNLIDRNRLKKFMQIAVDVTCMYTNFDGCDLSGFGDTATFKNGQFSLLTHGQ